MSKKILALVLILAAISGILVYAGTSHRSTPTTANTNQTVAQTISVVIDAQDGQLLSQTTYSVTTTAAATAFSVLRDATDKSGITLDYDPPGQYGVFVKAIGDKANTKQQYWVYQLNGQDGTVGADQQPVKDGDTVTWTYTTPTTN